MTCGTDSNKDCTLQSFERNRYFYSKLLTVSDFEIEQRYGINKDRLIHRLLHGHGISYGIEVTDITLNSQNNLAVKLTEGAALDCCGNEIIVPNRANAIELKNTPALADGATYYLYLEYAECLKDPMPQLVNGSSCEESCCYSRIQETFTLSVAKAPDTIISGKVVTQGTLTGIEDAKVVAFNTDGNIQGTAITNAAGDYQLPVLNNQAYDIKASASGYQSKTQRLSASVTQNIELVKTTPDCQASTENYAEAQLKTKPQCTDPKVLIAVFTVTANTPKKDDNQTKALRSYIYSNPMLHDLLCDHIGDLDNPHETTAAQVGALQSVNGVGNVSGQPYTSNIDLVSLDNKIRISPPDSPPSGVSLTNTQINLSLEDGAIDRRHLSSDVINNLITSNGTITITRTNNAGDDKEIGLSTSALQLGAMVSVNGVQNVNGNVSLQSPDTSILINSAAGAGVLGLTVNPGTNILSVRTAPAPGTAAKFAREDHVHNLADGVVTSAKIQAGAVTRATHLANDITALLTSNDNSVQIAPDPAAKTIDLSVQTGASSFVVATGVVVFQDMRPSGTNISSEIKPDLPSFESMDGVAIVMAVEVEKSVFMGDLDSIDPTVFPLTVATYPLGSTSFRIIIRDRRQQGDNFTWRVRWWAIPATVVMPDVEVPRSDDRFVIPGELILPRIGVRPGIMLRELAEELGIEPNLLEPELERLVAEGRIQRRRNGFFPPR